MVDKLAAGVFESVMVSVVQKETVTSSELQLESDETISRMVRANFWQG